MRNMEGIVGEYWINDNMMSKIVCPPPPPSLVMDNNQVIQRLEHAEDTVTSTSFKRL